VSDRRAASLGSSLVIGLSDTLLRIPRDREQQIHGMVNTDSTAT
jgi:hypothetical protein